MQRLWLEKLRFPRLRQRQREPKKNHTTKKSNYKGKYLGIKAKIVITEEL